MLIISSNILACIWYVVVEGNLHIDASHLLTNGSYLDMEDNWIDSFDMIDSKNSFNAKKIKVYMNCWYFMVVSMTGVGFGDYFPISTKERLFIILVMIYSGLSIGYTINTLSVIVKEINFDNKEKKTIISCLNDYTRNTQIHTKLLVNIKNYLNHSIQTSSLHSRLKQEKMIINYLHPSLKEKLFKIIYGRILRKIEFLNSFSDHF